MSVACASSRDASRRTVAYLTSRHDGVRLLRLPRLAAAPAGARVAAWFPERYLLFGLDQLVERGWAARHDLERAGSPPAWARAGGTRSSLRSSAQGLRRRLRDRARVAAGGESCRRRPLHGRHRRDSAAAVEKAGRVRPPLVYIAIGLPERLERLRSERMRRLYARRSPPRLRFSRTASTRLRNSMPSWRPTVSRLAWSSSPSGSMCRRSHRPSRPIDGRRHGGADPHRDVELFLSVAAVMASKSFRLVTTAERRARSDRFRRTSTSRPTSLSTRCDDGSRRPESSRFPFSRTATRGRRPSFCRRWRSRSRWSSRAPGRSPAATDSRTATTAVSRAGRRRGLPACRRRGAP